MSVLECKRVRSMVHISIPRTQENVRLSETVQLNFQEDHQVSITTTVDYYWALRVLANAWSWAGLFEATDHDGVKRVFMPLTDALNYADFCLRCTIEYGQGSLLWLQRNDILTRSKMAAYVRRGYTGASWRSPALQGSWTPEATSKPRVAAEPSEPPPKRPRTVKSDARQTVSMMKGGKAFCKAWNDQRGCKGGCNKLHLCDVRLESGQACQSSKHNRQNHE